MKKWDPNWTAEKVGSDVVRYDNYWAGAKKACDELGMSLPDKSKLQSIYQARKKDSSLGLPTSGWFVSSSEVGGYYVNDVHFASGSTSNNLKFGSTFKVLCVGD